MRKSETYVKYSRQRATAVTKSPLIYLQDLQMKTYNAHVYSTFTVSYKYTYMCTFHFSTCLTYRIYIQSIYINSFSCTVQKLIPHIRARIKFTNYLVNRIRNCR